MTGTSGDGLDLALIKIGPDNGIKFVASTAIEFPKALRKRLMQLSTPSENEIEIMGECDTELGEFTGNAIATFLSKTPIKKQQIKAIGSHGQTIRHRPPSLTNQLPFTLQIGNPHLIAEITGITTVADFRRRDIALGGQGAPLVPPFHKILFKDTSARPLILNIGGISNITVIGEPLLGFDTGPGNCLMDAWILQTKGEFLDLGGRWASSGAHDHELLNQLMSDPYYNISPPKSTGREYFNLNWLNTRCPNLNKIRHVDIQATLCLLTVETIIQAIQKLNYFATEILVCGGGRHNSHLMDSLKQKADCPVKTTEHYSINGDYIEAAAFAWLASRNLSGLNGNSSSVTGAKSEKIMGTIFPAA